MKEQTNQCITHTSHRGRGIPPLSTDRGNKEPRRRGERERGRYTYRGGRRKRKATIREKVITMARSRAWARLGPSSARLQERSVCVYITRVRGQWRTPLFRTLAISFNRQSFFFSFLPHGRTGKKRFHRMRLVNYFFFLTDKQISLVTFRSFGCCLAIFAIYLSTPQELLLLLPPETQGGFLYSRPSALQIQLISFFSPFMRVFLTCIQNKCAFSC